MYALLKQQIGEILKANAKWKKLASKDYTVYTCMYVGILEKMQL